MEPSSELDASQSQAVHADAGPLIVAAGPGTGKTRVFSHRVARLIRDLHASPRSILAVTFTRSAAAEMRGRIRGLLAGSGADLGELWIETCHAAAFRILREEAYPYQGEFSILREEDKPGLLEGLLPSSERASLLDEIRGLKQGLQWPQSGPALAFQQRLQERRLLDFDDLFLFVLRLFDEKPESLKRWRQRFDHVIMDEFQDTSLAQYRFISRLAGEDFCVIGDPDQSIYGFAATPFSPFAQFRRDHPGCRVLSLTENYRSQAVILDAAKQVIARNRAQVPRCLRARLQRGLPVDISGHQSDRQEAEMIARRVEGLLGGASRFTVDSGWAQTGEEARCHGLADIAILYRLNAQARLFETALERAGLPYVTYGKKIKKDGVLIDEAEDLEDFRDSETAAPRGEAITLMTVHRAKGLEFPVVFLTGCEDGVLPFRRAADGRRAEPRIEEERRLFYVGMTRARQRLFISYARQRFLFGKTLKLAPSAFVADIAEELRRIQEQESPPRKRPGLQPDLFNL
ncbi:MAG TPA: hypothetical protein DEB40_06030 [Elusimicrobia bacterium]|nr:hypothetical protein [Elusimicrobiota bacterium]HBT61285.1 hypothetical protein [Elusimicrobiota bacterium]